MKDYFLKVMQTENPWFTDQQMRPAYTKQNNKSHTFIFGYPSPFWIWQWCYDVQGPAYQAILYRLPVFCGLNPKMLLILFISFLCSHPTRFYQAQQMTWIKKLWSFHLIIWIIEILLGIQLPLDIRGPKSQVQVWWEIPVSIVLTTIYMEYNSMLYLNREKQWLRT